MLHRTTVARRAYLGKHLKEKHDNTINNLVQGKKYFKEVNNSVKLEQIQNEFHKSTYLIGIVSFLEAYISDILNEYLICFPGEIDDKSFNISSIPSVGSILGIIKKSTNKNIYDLTYESLKVVIRTCEDKFNFNDKIDDTIIKKIYEIKLSRNIVIHSNGIANETYVKKAGDNKRAKDGEKISLPNSYLINSTNEIIDFIDKFNSLMPQVYKEWGRIKTFKEMWEFTALNDLLKFEEAWKVEEDDDMVRPKKTAKKHPWSSSEKALYDFFLNIYGGNEELDIYYLFYKWPSDSPEGQIILSWLDSPFYF